MIRAVENPDIAGTTSDRPTICHVIHALGVGGAEVLVDTMLRRLTSRYRGIVAVLDEVGEIGERLSNDGFIVEHLHRQPGIDRQCASRLRRFADKYNASLLHAHQYTPFFQAMLSRGLFGRRPVVFTEHGRHFPDLPSRKRSAVNRLLLRKQDQLVGVGGQVRRALIDNEGLPADRVEVIYNGVDIASFATPAGNSRAEIRNEFGISSENFLVIQVARLHRLKGHETALRAIAEAQKLVPQMRLLIVGDGEERAAIELAIASEGLQDIVQLAGNRSDVADLLAASDAFLMTSISEGIPLTIIEAMAAGLPVVSTSVGGIPEMVTHEQSGLLASAGDHFALGRALVRVCNDAELRNKLIRSGRTVAIQQFSVERMLNSYADLYEKVLCHAR